MIRLAAALVSLAGSQAFSQLSCSEISEAATMLGVSPSSLAACGMTVEAATVLWVGIQSHGEDWGIYQTLVGEVRAASDAIATDGWTESRARTLEARQVELDAHVSVWRARALGAVPGDQAATLDRIYENKSYPLPAYFLATNLQAADAGALSHAMREAERCQQLGLPGSSSGGADLLQGVLSRPEVVLAKSNYETRLPGLTQAWLILVLP